MAKTKTTNGKRGRGRPKGEPYKGILTRLPLPLLDWLNKEYRRRGLPTRLDLIRTILEDARK